ncbi:MAG: peptide chain release factor N(5)-glutamine methyltransferase [Planctomycetaceae bacterium]
MPSPAVTKDDQWTVRRIIEWTTGHLKNHGSETPRLDAEILLAHARNCRRIELYTRFDEPLTDPQRAAMRDLVRRRAQSEPVAYLVGHREFFSLDFRVTPDVLVPRPDTETLVLELLDRVRAIENPRLLDIGTGSGCIAVSAAVNLPTARVTAIDISPNALAIARENAETHNVLERMRFLEGDLFGSVPAGETFHAIASNPPYIRAEELESLQADVRLHEPRLALISGPEGLEVIRRIVDEAPSRLVAGGTLLFEFSPEQAGAVEELLQASSSYRDIKLVKDLTNRPRVAVAVKN